MKKHICVYCGSRTGSNPGFPELAEQAGREIANRDWGIVYGGGKVGMMGKIADAALNSGGDVIGVIPTRLKNREVAHLGLTDLHETQDMHTRKALMESLSDAFLVLPGGFGTLDEFFEILTWRQLGIHNKPIFLMNADGYFDGLIQYTENAIKYDFIQKESLSLFNVCDDLDSCLKQLERFFELD
ncbi:TIGR00730 family Rossman fold protein [Gracilimonas tropica]|uniref:LOG family protein n=1 Tax=Gracilimonas tropica TaxID=454600 RepID=UPI00036BDB27|nr:TIGR00730 family Rossman fold protein [Gracilimonas tropica]